MGARKDKLNRLEITSPCQQSWDEMQGEAAHRHCAQCDRQVLDFGQMTPREIEARIEASRGRLCARITRDGAGRLVTLPTPEPVSSWSRERGSPMAAALVAAFLGLGPATAQSTVGSTTSVEIATNGAEQAGMAKGRDRAPQKGVLPASATVSLRGVVTDPEGLPFPGFEILIRSTLSGEEWRAFTGGDGGFAFDDLEAGVYDLEATLEGFTIPSQSGLLLRPGETTRLAMTAQSNVEETITVGGASIESEPLRQEFDDSALVVVGTAGPSVAIDPNRLGEVATEMHLQLVLKGRETRRSIRIYHAEPEEVGVGRFAPGTRILAFLKPHEGEDGAYNSADYASGLKDLPDAELSAYRERIESLARLRRDPRLRPDDLIEWLVATTEEPITRKAAVVDIQRALRALDVLAEDNGTSPERAAGDLRAIVTRRLDAGQGLKIEPSPALLGAFLSPEQKERLSRALEATTTLDRFDLVLYEIVKPWDSQAALAWFVRQLRRVNPPSGEGDRMMDTLAQGLGNQRLQALVKSAEDRLLEIYYPKETPQDDSVAAVQAAERAVENQLLRDFRRVLAAAE